ncbi:SDR family oxidoreductase [Acuticoccus sp. M5D2P5]|uniref:SDR family NAD(P)-dependent oxidoreductase n=1 Tax=Acuticoccus kalidii TaxID=2910977 RepID=UPI001F2D281F|nr:SDR family NAD(P)-dependent oxidoreductase [Acuticoccus kalidii]MCF3935709.1 SDR family oxidoreductase [Acuticoccus kalidii]
MRNNFNGKVALVTGGAQGIGQAIGEAFVKGGARVHLADIAAGVADGGAAIGCPTHIADLSRPDEAASMVEGVIAAEGRIDILALAAGGVCGQESGIGIEETTIEGWHALFAANVDAAFNVVKAAAPHLRANGWGRIVTISSSAGIRPSLTGLPGYTAAKHALVGLTRQMSAELGPHGVTANSVAPGLILSNPSTIKQWENYGPDRQNAILASLHTRRLGKASDIAAAVAFLASEDAGWITGQILPVDGGRL